MAPGVGDGDVPFLWPLLRSFPGNPVARRLWRFPHSLEAWIECPTFPEARSGFLPPVPWTAICRPGQRFVVGGRRLAGPPGPSMVRGRRPASGGNGSLQGDDDLPPSTMVHCKRTTLCRRVRRFAAVGDGPSFRDDASPPRTAVRRRCVADRRRGRQTAVCGQRTVAAGDKAPSAYDSPSFREAGRRLRTTGCRRLRQSVVHVRWTIVASGRPSYTDY